MTILEQLAAIEDQLDNADSNLEDAQSNADTGRGEAERAENEAYEAKRSFEIVTSECDNIEANLRDMRELLTTLTTTVQESPKAADEPKARLAAAEKPVAALSDAELRVTAERHMHDCDPNKSQGENIATVAGIMYLDYEKVHELLVRAA